MKTHQTTPAASRRMSSGPPVAGDPLLTKAEVKVILRVKSDATIWRWCRRGRMPRPYQLGGRVVWFQSEIDAFISSMPAA